MALVLRTTLAFAPLVHAHGTGVWIVFHPLTTSSVLFALVAVLLLASHPRSRHLARL